MELTSESLKEILKNSSTTIKSTLREFSAYCIDDITENTFDKAISIGIENTIAALYNANVPDAEILRVVHEHWGISKNDTIAYLVEEKIKTTKSSLNDYLRLQGMVSLEIENFYSKLHVNAIIRHSPELWQLKNNPEKLIQQIKENELNNK